MLKYHGRDVLDATHPYSSKWYQWLVNGRPILYYNTYTGNMRSSFSAFGNPAVWWGGLIAIAAMVVRAKRHKDGKALFILIGYLSQILPWIAIERVLFIYHYFPSTIFIIMALAHVFNTIYENKRGRYKMAVYGYTAATGALFVMFFPALTGMSVSRSYFSNFLRWIPGAWPM
jgi:dolichyl-phosphate-mannose--protein O-mannosyl transferase